MDKRKNKGSIILIFLIVLMLGIIGLIILKKPNSNNENNLYEIVLIGDESITINQGEIYQEPGYYVIKNDEKIEKEVKISSNINVNKIGSYIITYRIIEDNKIVSEKERKVIVTATSNNDITLTLNGEEVEYILKNSLYTEKGAKAFNKGTDITSQITIDGSVNSSKVGDYVIYYKVLVNNQEKKISRTVKVIDAEVIHTIDNSNKVIKLSIYSDYFDYVLLPNEQTSKNKNIDYSFNDDGNYKFIVYLSGGLFKEYNVVVSIPKPTGYCQALVDGSSTEFKIVNGSSNITKYQYNGTYFYTNNYKINYEVSNPIIRIYAGDDIYTDITCAVKRIFSNNLNNINLSTTLTPCNYNWSSYNNELSKLMNEAGSKTRTAVAIAADYLARFDYKVAYSWGGQSLSYGINPKWGCEETVTKDVCTKSTGNMKCIYGMDCTGYTAWAFYQAGFPSSILRTSSQSEGMWGNFNASKHKYSFKGNSNLFNQIKPGDIVWTEGHVGIVLGTSPTQLKVANMREGIRISYINTSGYSTNGDKSFTHFVLFDEFFNMYGSNT